MHALFTKFCAYKIILELTIKIEAMLNKVLFSISKGVKGNNEIHPYLSDAYYI